MTEAGREATTKSTKDTKMELGSLRKHAFFSCGDFVLFVCFVLRER
jgi:hypothetical protein